MGATRDTSRFDASAEGSLALVAVAGMVAWVVSEFALRRGLGPGIADALGSGFAAEGAIMVLAIPAVAAIVAWVGVRGGVAPADWEYDVTPRTVGAGLGGGVAYVAVSLAIVLGLVAILGLDPTAGAAGVADGSLGDVPAWAIALFLVGNGVVVPLSEELAWRGVIQTALDESVGTAVAIVATALAFVAKHLVVDLAADPFRVASLLVLAFVLCGLRARFGTASATVTHVGVNLLATASVLLV